jgi:hypothetical protein
MAKKIKPTLVHTDSVIYAVLCPGIGFLKKDGGRYYFYDQLPRASGCYVTYEEADALRAKVLEKTYAAWQEAEKDEYPNDYWINRCKSEYDHAMSAAVVRIEWN